MNLVLQLAHWVMMEASYRGGREHWSPRCQSVVRVPQQAVCVTERFAITDKLMQA